MAQRMSIQLVVEGVETFKHWNIAKNNGCDVAQGYFISKPIAIEKVVSWCAHWEAQTC